MMEEDNTKKINERRVFIVIIFTILAMAAEIFFGFITKSMSLLAEGVHMSVHILTLSLTYAAYVLARKFEKSDLFSNGTDKICTLAGYTSSIFLGLTAIWIFYESFMRFVAPENIHFNEAIYASIFAFVINLICIFVMEGKLELKHTHFDNKTDYNYAAAYYHILSDVLVSILTILALVLGKYFNCTHLDAFTGILGAFFIILWAFKLIVHSTKILIDMKQND